MRFQQLNRTDGDKVFISVRNVSGAALSKGAAVYFDDSAVDGNAVSGAMTSKSFLFAGILNTALDDDAYGEAQVYGVCSAYFMPATSAVSYALGQQLVAVASQVYLSADPGTVIVGSSAATTIYTTWPFATLYEAVASAAALSNTPALKKIFVRAL